MRLHSWQMPKSSTARITSAAFLVLVGLPFLGWWWETAPQRHAERIVSDYEKSTGKHRGQLYAELVERDLATILAESGRPEAAETVRQADQQMQELLQNLRQQGQQDLEEGLEDLTKEQRMLVKSVLEGEKRAKATQRKSGILTDEAVRTLADRITLFKQIQGRRE